MDKKEREDHLKRKDWNERAIAKLGLRLEKQNEQSISIRLYQGEAMIYSDWTSVKGNDSVYRLHKNLEDFLKSYIEHLLKFEQINIAVGHLVMDLSRGK